MRDRLFQGTEKDYTRYIQVLEALDVAAGAKVVDFGCSWGYGSFQLSEHGYEVSSVELSPRRRTFASEKLDVDLFDSHQLADNSFDVFFSAHVLEHVPTVSEVVALARRIVKPGGLMVSFTPNGSMAYRQQNPGGWASSWGSVHPIHIDEQFVRHLGEISLVDSTPFDLSRLRSWSAAPTSDAEIPNLLGKELLSVLKIDRT